MESVRSAGNDGETIQAYEEHADELRQCLDEMTEERWSGDVTFNIQGHAIPAKMDDLFRDFFSTPCTIAGS